GAAPKVSGAHFLLVDVFARHWAGSLVPVVSLGFYKNSGEFCGHDNMKVCRLKSSLLSLVAAILATPATYARVPQDYASMAGEPGVAGGQLVVALRSEPKTLNPILSVDATSREVIGAMQADLVHINRETQRTEAALAKSWSASQG